MTGRAAGFCAGYGMPGYANPGGGRGGGFGFGRGRGRGGGGWGWRHRYWATGLPGWQRADLPPPAPGWYGPAGQSTPAQELEVMRGQAEQYEEALRGIRERIERLEQETKEQA
jgi:hypothetical protein